MNTNLALAVLVYLVWVIDRHDCSIRERLYMYGGQRRHSTVMATYPNISKMQCMILCTNDITCQALSVIKTDESQICEISKTLAGSGLIADPQAVYYGMYFSGW